MKLNIHSVTDVITNSSSEVYICTNGIQVLEDFINALLKASGSEQTCRELFDISDNGSSYSIISKNGDSYNLSLINSLFYASDYCY